MIQIDPEDTHLPPELKLRIDRYVESRSEMDPDAFRKELELSSTFNAMVRREIRKGNL